jgi:hypothetical protein
MLTKLPHITKHSKCKYTCSTHVKKTPTLYKTHQVTTTTVPDTHQYIPVPSAQGHPNVHVPKHFAVAHFTVAHFTSLSGITNICFTSPHVKFNENLCCGSRVVLCRWTDRQTNKRAWRSNGSFSQLSKTRQKTKLVQSASGLSIKPTTFRTARDSEGVRRAGGCNEEGVPEQSCDGSIWEFRISDSESLVPGAGLYALEW